MEYLAAILFVAVLVILILIGSVYLRSQTDSKETNVSAPHKSYMATDSSDDYAEGDRTFEAVLAKVMGPHIRTHFYTKVVGITFKNAEGIVGERLIRRCKQFDFVCLVPEPENPFDKNAIAVRLKGGSCVGHLDSRTAQETSARIRKGQRWLACVKLAKSRARGRHGCLVLCMMEVDPEFAIADADFPHSLSFIG